MVVHDDRRLLRAPCVRNREWNGDGEATRGCAGDVRKGSGDRLVLRASTDGVKAGGMEILMDPVDKFPLREEFADSLEHPDLMALVVLRRGGPGHKRPRSRMSLLGAHRR